MTDTMIATDDIERFVRLAFEPGEVVELRVLTKREPRSGYFNDSELLAEAAFRESQAGHNVYYTLNSPEPGLLFRASNEVRRARSGDTTNDDQITKRRRLLIDIDPIRWVEGKAITGIPASESEVDAAIAKAEVVQNYLANLGFPDPLILMSGNGCQLVYRYDVLDDEGTLKRFLEVLAARFDDEDSTVDTCVWNPSRISRFPGTGNRKGSHTDERPHRLARILHAPDTLEPVAFESLRAIVNASPVSVDDPQVSTGIDMQGFLDSHKIKATLKTGKDESKYDGGRVWELDRCPFADHEKDGKACVFVRRGVSCFKCQADKCNGNGWKEFFAEVASDGEMNPNAKSTVRAIYNLALEQDDFFRSLDNVPYVSVKYNGKRELIIVGSEYESFIMARYQKMNGKPLEPKTASKVYKNLYGLARWNTEQREVHVRVAGGKGVVYIDMANDAQEVIKVTAEGYDVIPCPDDLYFYRDSSMAPLPRPESGGNVQALEKYVHVDPEFFPLILACLIAGLLPQEMLIPVLVLLGGPGMGKTTIIKVVQRFLDPKVKDAVCGAPKSPDDLMIRTVRNRLLTLNNLSEIKAALSDLLCGLAEGTTYKTRKLFTNGEEFSITARRPIVISSVKGVVTASDLVDRSLIFEIPEFEGTTDELGMKSKGPEEFWEKFDTEYSRILGALLDGLVAALRDRPKVDSDSRLQDFLRCAIAAERVWGYEPGTMLRAFNKLQNRSSLENLSGSPLGQAILALKDPVTGTAKELASALKLDMTAREFTDELRYATADLRKVGIGVVPGKNRHKEIKTYTINPTTLVAFDPGDSVYEYLMGSVLSWIRRFAGVAGVE